MGALLGEIGMIERDDARIVGASGQRDGADLGVRERCRQRVAPFAQGTHGRMLCRRVAEG